MSQYYTKFVDIHSFLTYTNFPNINDGVAFFALEEKCHVFDSISKLDVFLLIIGLSGKTVVTINSVCYDVCKGDILMCKPSDVIDYCSFIDNSNGYLICMSRQFMLECVLGHRAWIHAFLPGIKPVLHLRSECFESIKLFISLLDRNNKNQYNRDVILSIIQGIQCELLSELKYNMIEEKIEYKNQSILLFQRFLDLLVGAQVKPRTVSWYSEKLFVSPKYLSSVCKIISGRTAIQWIKEYVIMDICFYLKYSSKSIKEVSIILDFPNLSFFGKYVRSNLGVSPSKYRKNVNKLFENE